MSNLNPEAPSITPANHTQDAQTIVDALRVMRQTIPHFVIPPSSKAPGRLTTVASLPPEFIEISAMAVRNSLALVRGGATEPAAIRDLMTFGDAYVAVPDELEALAQFIRYSIAAAKHKAGLEALTIYSLAKRLAKRPENADLVPLVADLRRALGARFKRKAADPETPTTPAPTTPPPVTPVPKT